MVPNNPWNNFELKKPMGRVYNILAKNLVLDEHFVLSFLLTTIIPYINLT